MHGILLTKSIFSQQICPSIYQSLCIDHMSMFSSYVEGSSALPSWSTGSVDVSSSLVMSQASGKIITNNIYLNQNPEAH